jgi:lipopolysaccharide biosynthesis glycosyltransferase
MTLHVAVVTDRSYLPWCATTVRSCIDRHAPGDVQVHVVHDGSVTTADAERLHSIAPDAVEVHGVDPARVRHLPAVDRFGHVVWLRFLLGELLPAGVDRVLYLDADTLVVDDLTALADRDLRGAPLAAVPNVMLDADEERLRQLTGGRAPAFLNSGVLLLDLHQWRRDDLAGQIVAAARAHASEIRWPDQDVLNLVFADRWHRLPARYNAQNSYLSWRRRAERTLGAAEVEEALRQPAVVHFEGPLVCKPWHLLNHHPWRDDYRATLRRSPWSDTELEGGDRATRLIARLPRSWQLPLYEQLVLARRGDGASLRSLVAGVRRRAADAERPLPTWRRPRRPSTRP